MKKYTFLLSSAIFFLSAVLLTGCGNNMSENKGISAEKAADAESSGTDAGSSSALSGSGQGASSGTDSVFSKTEPFIDDTGKTSMQRDGNYLYSYFDGRLMRTDNETGETVILYKTSYLHKLRFCLSGNYIYFIERTGCESLDHRDTSLYRMEKNGKNLTLLQDRILNASSMESQAVYPFNITENDTVYLYDAWRDYNDRGIYESIDIYDNIIYLIRYSYIYDYENPLPVSDGIYFKLEEDGTVREIEEKETLYGKLPQGFFPIHCYDGFPSFPYAMRNYGYLFVQDADQMIYRIDPLSGVMESLGLSSDDFKSFAFSGDMIFLKPDDTIFLFDLTDKTMTETEDTWAEKAYFYGVFPAQQGFLYCGNLYRADYAADTAEPPGSYICRILPDGSADLLFSGLLDTPGYQGTPIGFRTDNCCCIFDDYFYYIDTIGTSHSLMRLSIQENPAFQELETWPLYPAAAEMVEKNEKIDFGDSDSLFISMNLLFLKEETKADTRINQALAEIYAEFETYINDRAQFELEQSESKPDYLEDVLRGYSTKEKDFLISVFCNYINDDVISFACYYTYFPYGLLPGAGCEYYVFDRHNGKQLTFEDFEGDSAHIIDVVSPYLERAVEWELSPENILDPRDFSLSDDGYTLYFVDIRSREYDWFTVTIPYDAFEQTP